jgi:hypothetical protein
VPKTITKRCILCRALLRVDRRTAKADRIEMRKRDGVRKVGRPICQHCFDCGPAVVAQKR